MVVHIYSWGVGCSFRQINPDGSESIVHVEEKDLPNSGLCCSKVSGVWYGNNEIKHYIKKGYWLPYSGLFGLVAVRSIALGGRP